MTKLNSTNEHMLNELLNDVNMILSDKSLFLLFVPLNRMQILMNMVNGLMKQQLVVQSVNLLMVKKDMVM